MRAEQERRHRRSVELNALSITLSDRMRETKARLRASWDKAQRLGLDVENGWLSIGDMLRDMWGTKEPALNALIREMEAENG